MAAAHNSNNFSQTVTSPEEDDGVSFGSDITVEPDDDAAETGGRTEGGRRAYWAPDARDKFKSGSSSSGRMGNNFLETSIDDVIVTSGNDSEVTEGREGVSKKNNTGAYTTSTEDSWPAKICKVITKLLPSLCLTCVIQFMDLLAGVSYYLIGLVIFQVIFWPSICYVIYCKFVVKRAELLEPIAKFRGGNWIHFFLLQVHGAIVVGAVLLQILSIQYLDVTVSLAMSFLPVIVLILIEHIMESKGCSPELLVSLVVGYIGVICAAIPALLASHPYIQWLIYSGIAASIGSSLLTIQASLLLKYLRHRRIDDSLLTATVGLKGTLVCLTAGLLKGVIRPIDAQNSGYISAIVSFGTVASFLLIFKLRPPTSCSNPPSPSAAVTSPELETGSQDPQKPSFPLGYTCVLKLRILVFALSLIWAILKQFYRHTFPSVFSVLGVTLITCAFLLAVAFKEWYALVQRPEQSRQGPAQAKQTRSFRLFEVVPWLFSRRPILYIH